MRKHILAGISLLACGSLFLAACSAKPTPATPTVDPNIIYTQAVQTVQANIKNQPTVAPTDTPQPTQTPAPTNTMDPTIAAGLTATIAAGNQAVQPPAGQSQTPAAGQTPGVPTATATKGAAVTIPTATKAAAAGAPAQNTGDKCEWVSNSPKDNSQIPNNSDFDANIVVKNIGTTTWNTQYALRYFAGERMGVPGDYYVTREVKPNETYTFSFVMKSPDSLGKKEVLIAIQNPTGATMCWINMPLEIID